MTATANLGTLKPGTDPVVSVRREASEFGVLFEESGGGLWAAQYTANGDLIFTLWNGTVGAEYRQVDPERLAALAGGAG